jgi:hypothetical protein
MLAISAAARLAELIRASVVAFALIDVVPHIAARETHERPSEFSIINQKGLFQHNRREADIDQNRRSCSAGGQQFYQSDSLRTSIVRDVARTVISK